MKTQLHLIFEDDAEHPRDPTQGREFVNLLADNGILSREWAKEFCNLDGTKYVVTVDVEVR